MTLASDLQSFLTAVLTPAQTALIRITTVLDTNSQLTTIADRLLSGSSVAALVAALSAKVTACNTGAVVVSSGAVTVSSGAVVASAGTNLNTSALALEAGGNLAAAKADLDKVVLAEGGFWTPVQVHGGGSVYDVTTAAGGGAGSDYYDLAASATYLLRADPDWTGGAADSDVVRGCFKLGGAPSGDDDGWYIRSGEQVRIGPLTGVSTVYLRAHAVSVVGRWKLYRKDA